MAGKPHIQAFFDEPTFTVSYLVGDPQCRRNQAKGDDGEDREQPDRDQHFDQDVGGGDPPSLI